MKYLYNHGHLPDRLNKLQLQKAFAVSSSHCIFLNTFFRKFYYEYQANLIMHKAIIFQLPLHYLKIYIRQY